MPGEWSFTEPQDGVDGNRNNLIRPGDIPEPQANETALGFAARRMRTWGESIHTDTEDAQTTWQGLSAHYNAPEEEVLFAAMDPAVGWSEDLQTDLSAVADVLEDYVEAVSTAKSELAALKTRAKDFVAQFEDSDVWWGLQNPLAVFENEDLKDEVNQAWSTFNEAEITCANAIAALCGGPEYVSPDQATGADQEIPYGLATDAGGQSRAFSWDYVSRVYTDAFAWQYTDEGERPLLLDWGFGFQKGFYQTVYVDIVWGTGVMAVAATGHWSPNSGWTLNPLKAKENQGEFLMEGAQGTLAYVGLHGDDGWLLSKDEKDFGWDPDKAKANAESAWLELREGFFAWSSWGDDPGYGAGVTTVNTATLPIGGTVRLLKDIFGIDKKPDAQPDPPSEQSVWDMGDFDFGGATPHAPSGSSGPPGSPLNERFDDVVRDLDFDFTGSGRGPSGPTPPTSPDAPNTPVSPPSTVPPHTPTPNTPPPGPSPSTSPSAPASPSPETKPVSGTPAVDRRNEVDGQSSSSSSDSYLKEEKPEGTGQSSTGDSREKDTSGQGDNGSSQGERGESGDPIRLGEDEKTPNPESGGGNEGGGEPPRDRPQSGGEEGEGEPYRSPQPGTPEYESRLQELIDDPASGPANTPHKEAAVRREAEVGLKAEQMGFLEGPIRRGEMDYTDPSNPKDGGDFVDAKGRAWDVKGFRDTFPPTAGPMAGKPLKGRGAFNIDTIKKAIEKEIKGDEGVLLDLNVLSDASNKDAIRNLVQGNSDWIGKVFIVYV